MNCEDCKNYWDDNCCWEYMYLDTDYAYDCCDFIELDFSENS